MKTSAALATFFAALAACRPAHPKVNDAIILNYALTLEHLEDKFYREGLANYTEADFQAAGFANPFYDNLKIISSDETTHVNFLTGAIKAAGYHPVDECVYAFPSTSAASFVAVASVLEGVGVSAYLGAAAYISNKAYLTAAGSILTIESRHSSYIRNAVGEKPFPAPFDTPLDFSPVYSLAAQFIKSCPSTNGALPFVAFPPLAVTTTGTLTAGQTITLDAPTARLRGNANLYVAFFLPGGPVFMPVSRGPGKTVMATIPSNAAGQAYAVITNSNKAADDSVIVAGPALVEVN